MPHASLAIRPFAAADLPALQQIRSAAFAPVFRSFGELVGPDIAETAFRNIDADQARMLDGICSEGSAHRLLVVMLGQEIVGFVSFSCDPENGTGEIGLNAVHPAQAGRGIGAWMYEEALARMKALGVRVVEVGTGGDASHAPARRAYEKVGFKAGIPSVTLYKRL